MTDSSDSTDSADLVNSTESADLADSTCSEKYLGIKIDNKLTFEEHVEGLCKKTSQKFSAVARISSLMRFEQKKRIFNLFITSHFSYWPLV